MKKLFILVLLGLSMGLLFPSIVLHADNANDNMIPDTLYSTDLIIADIIIDSTTYNVDPTGYEDSTAGINKAISDCYDLGGGTVFLPSGKYRVSSNITILPFVTLQGDYNDPDSSNFNGDYGTMIYADVESSEDNFPSLFTVGGSAGAIGLTIYYPYQTTENVKPYPYTFEIPSFASVRGHADHMASTIKDITMINSYKGIAASITPSGSLVSAANEMIHLENIKGTILYKGFELYNSSEYGVVKEITINNSYWANAASYLSSPEKDDIDDFTMSYGIGMQLGDLEWVVFTNIDISDYHVGIRIFDGLRRYIAGQPEIYFIGQFYGLTIQNTDTALRVDNIYPNFGVNIANAYLSGNDYAVYRTDTTNSVVNFVGSTLVGDVYGSNIIESGADDDYQSETLSDSSQEVDYSNINKVVYNVIDYYADLSGTYDSSVAIQNALNDAHQNGGGIVYLPAGYYKLSNNITVYDNTLLRGSSAVNPRDEIGLSLGTVILSEFGYTLNENDAMSGVALITIEGDNAGVSGIRIHYPLNIPDYVDGDIRLHTYAIRILGNNDFVTHTSLAGVAYGIEILGTSDSPIESPIIQGVNGTFYRKALTLQYTNNAYLEEILSNGSVVSRTGLSSLFPQYYTNAWPTDANGGLTGVYDNITRPYSFFFNVISSSGVIIRDSFTFASNTFLLSVDSDVTMINNSGDNLYPTGYLLRLERSELIAVNLMRYSGTSVQLSNSTISVFNRLSLLENTESDLYNSVQKSDSFLEQTKSLVASLPDEYSYNSSLDPSIDYPITSPDDEPTNPDDPQTSSAWVYYVFGGVIVLIGFGVIIIVKKR